ncbi:MAG: hypothetical protein PUG74_11335 [Prevotellaceae bacterium]|nr:hypothetical protein [Prevotellaceae bacterium]
MLEKIQVTRDSSGELAAVTWDSTGSLIDLALSKADNTALAALMDKAKEARPKWERDVEMAQKNEQQAQQERADALVAKREAEGDKARAEAKAENEKQAREAAETEKAQAIADKKAKERELEEWKEKLALALTGGLQDDIKDDTIKLYAEWQPGLSVDAGDWYRVGLHMIRAKVDHITSAENAPTGEHAADYWEGVPIPADPTAPAAKYPKGTVIEWSGVQYRALKDTDKDPGAAPEDWELVQTD